MNTISSKLVGAVFVALAAWLVSRRYREETRTALLLTEDAVRFVTFVSESISYHGTPVGEIIASYKPLSTEMCDFYRRAAESSLADELRGHPTLYDPEVYAIMLDFSLNLGHGYTDSQLKLCELTQRRLREHCAVLAESAKNKERSSTATAVFAAASIILILI